MSDFDFTVVNHGEDLHFVSHGTYSGRDGCEVIIDSMAAAENLMDDETDHTLSAPTFRLYNAEVSGKGILQISTHTTNIAVRPTTVSFGQDRVVVDGVMTRFDGYDDRGEEFAMEFPILVRVQVLYTAR